MQQSRPLPSFGESDELDFAGAGMPFTAARPVEVPLSQPVLSGPLFMITDQYGAPVAGPRTTEELTAITGQLGDEPRRLSLLAALQSTISANAPGRTVVIPADKKRKKASAEHAAPARRMNPHLRHGIVLAAILCIVATTLLTLTPLATGQSAFGMFSAFGNWVHEQQMNWEIQSHDTLTTTSQPVQNNSAPPPMDLPKSQYIAIAQQDAITAGIPPDYFVRQIDTESGFNPNAVSPAGAVGIAQFLPSTAAGLGINPWDPIQALRAAANMMAGYARQYGGDYAKALAAYNSGTGTVQYAINNCGTNWLNCLPGETRHYIYVIMGI